MVSRKSFILGILVMVFISGCATTRLSPLIKYKAGNVPSHNQVAEVDVGGSIYSEFDYIEKTGAQLIHGYNQSFGLGTIRIEPGSFLIGYKNESEEQYCTEKRAYYDLLVGPYDFVCFSGAGDGTFTKVRVPTIMFGRWKEIEGIQYKQSEATNNAKGRKHELLYQGVSGNTIKVAYREYIDNLARPAFYQEVSYNLSENGTTELRFKGVHISVLKADNNGLKYVVKSGFSN